MAHPPGGVGVAGQDRADRGRAYLVCDGSAAMTSAMCVNNPAACGAKAAAVYALPTIMPENYIAMFNAPPEGAGTERFGIMCGIPA